MYRIMAFTQWPLKSGAMLMMTVIQGIEEEIKQNHIACMGFKWQRIMSCTSVLSD